MAVADPILISGVRAVIQLYTAGDKALARHVRDRAIVIPGAMAPLPTSIKDNVLNRYEDDDAFKAIVDGEEEFETALETVRSSEGFEQSSALEVLHFEMIRYEQVNDTDASERFRDEVVFGRVLSQWGEGEDNGLLPPWQEFALAFGRVMLEFVGTNPSVLQIGGDAEKLVGSFSKTVSEIMGEKSFTSQHFGSQMLTIVARAGLQTLSDNREIVFDDLHIQDLVEQTTLPVIEKLKELENDTDRQREWKGLVLELIGPVSEVAFGVLADHQEAFLGSKYETGKMLGILTNTFLRQAQDGALRQLLTEGSGSKEAALRLFSSLAAAAAEHPELVIEGDDAHDQLLRDFFTGALNAIAASPNFDKALGLEVMRVGIDALSKNTPALIKLSANETHWEAVIERSINSVLGGLSDAAAGERKLEDVLSKAQIIELGRIFFTQVAATPGMIAGDNKELRTVVKAIATAMAADDKLLMSGDDWLTIAEVAIREAARNPGRLFGFDDDGYEPSLGSKAIGEVLNAAADALTLGREGGSVLFGATLRIAIETALKALSDNSAVAKKVLSQVGKLRDLGNQITIVITETEDDAFKFGSKEWLALWRTLLAEYLTPDKELEAIASVVTPLLEDDILDGAITPAGQEFIKSVLYT